jgi:hypothetical protein
MTKTPKSEVPVVHRVPAHLARLFHQICLGALAEITGPEDLSPLQYGIIGSIQSVPTITSSFLKSGDWWPGRPIRTTGDRASLS